MELDKRNPFASWGFEQEVYTTLDNIEAGYQNPIAADETNYNTVAEGPVDENGNKLPFDGQATFFTNNENMSPVAIQNYALGFNNNIQPEYNSNEELHYYGIQADDLKKYETEVIDNEEETENTPVNETEPTTVNETPINDGE
jgi:hypothetical protein